MSDMKNVNYVKLHLEKIKQVQHFWQEHIRRNYYILTMGSHGSLDKLKIIIFKILVDEKKANIYISSLKLFWF